MVWPCLWRQGGRQGGRGVLHRGAALEVAGTAWRWGSQSARSGSRLLPRSAEWEGPCSNQELVPDSREKGLQGQAEPAPGTGASSTPAVLRPLALGSPHQPAHGNTAGSSDGWKRGICLFNDKVSLILAKICNTHC